MIYFAIYLAIGLAGLYFLINDSDSESKKLKEEIQGALDFKPLEAVLVLMATVIFWLPLLIIVIFVGLSLDEK